MKKQLTIAVTGLNAIESPGPGIAVIRGLKESPHFDVRIIGLAYENLEPGIYMRDLVDKVYQIPYPAAGYETLLDRLWYVHQKEKLDVVIPNFDAELFGFMKAQPTLKSWDIACLLPTFEQFDARLKGNLNKFGEDFGIKVPKSVSVFNVVEMHEALKDFEFPVVVKGKFYEAYVAYSVEQADAFFYKISAKWGTPIILQQFVKGQEYNVTALGDGKGRLVGAVPMRKTYITDAGKAWAGISIADNDLLAMAKNVVCNSKWGGGMELECIKEDKTGDVYLIEINPRFPAWVYLAVGCGQNHPDALVRLALGEDVPSFETYDVGKMFIRYSFDMICDLATYAQISTIGEV